MLSASPKRACLRDRKSNVILLLWYVFTQFILILQEAFVQLERSTFVLVSYTVICSVLRSMVLILILIEGDYILFIIGGGVLLCFKHFGPIQNHNLCATCKILSFYAQRFHWCTTCAAQRIFPRISNKSNLVLDLHVEQLGILKLCKIAYKHRLFFYPTWVGYFAYLRPPTSM